MDRPRLSAVSGAGRLRVVLAALAVAAASCEWATRGYAPGVRNALADAALAAIVASACFLRGRARDLPFPRRRLLASALPAALAVVAAWPTIGLPYLSDDWFHLDAIGAYPTPLHAVTAMPQEIFFRPTAYPLWWLFDHFAPVDATLAHCTCVAIFAAIAALVVPALRRCGVPRGVAVASALVFAASPAALDTVAWNVNLYSLLSAGFSLATIAWLPFRRATAGTWARTFALSALAMLSKEDSYLLPALVAAAGARFRLRHWRRGLRLAAPAAAALACVVALRWIVLGGIGGYRDSATGEPLVLRRWLEGATETLVMDFPTAYFTPWRGWQGASRAASLIALLPFVWLAAGGASAAARNGVPRGVAIAAATLMPVLGVLPVGPSLGNARQIFAPSIGIALIAASLIAGIPFGARARWACVALAVALSVAVGRRNFRAWEETARLFRGCADAVASPLAALPADATVLVTGLPEIRQGTYCFLNAAHVALPRWSGRRDLKVHAPSTPEGVFDAMLEVDPRSCVARDVSRVEPDRAIAAGETVLFDLTSAETRRLCRAAGWSASVDADGSWTLVAHGDASTLLLPVVGVPAGARVRVHLDASAWRSERATKPEIVVTTEQGGRLLRRPAADGETIPLPSDARTLRVEVRVPLFAQLKIRSARIEAE